jgi:hypothetical protein
MREECFLREKKETSAGEFPGGGLKKEDRIRQTMILLLCIVQRLAVDVSNKCHIDVVPFGV